jgi:hypothetical protein
MYRRFGLQFGHAPSVLPARDNGMLALLRYWDLVEEHPDQREDGGHSGWWRVTGLGERFIKEQVEVPKYAVIFDSKLLRLDGSTTVGIREVLGTKFDLEELMSS